MLSKIIAGGRDLVYNNGSRWEGASNSRPPNEGDLNIGEIPIILATRHFSRSLGQYRKPG